MPAPINRTKPSGANITTQPKALILVPVAVCVSSEPIRLGVAAKIYDVNPVIKSPANIQENTLAVNVLDITSELTVGISTGS